MSATATTHRRTGLALGAQAYLFAVYAAAFGAYGLVIATREPIDQADWSLAILLAAGAAVAQLFVVLTPRNQSYQTAPVFVVAAAILLPPPLLALVVIVQHVPEWLRERYPWYIQTFNIANYGLCALAAQQMYSSLASTADGAGVDSDLAFFLAGLGAAAVFVAVNHVLLAEVLKLARGHSFRQSGLFTPQSMSTDLVIALLGVVFAAIWLDNPWLALLALAPLVLVQRTLALPKLEAEARQDPKTELYNARHFSGMLEQVLERTRRTGRPASILVADLDLLREINNRYGHLAGDAVLVGVARILQAELRPEDVAARFGGEEFALLLPDTTEEEAAAVAERIRATVGETGFDVDTSSHPISATVSIGVATFPVHATSPADLIYRADVAAYRAKAQGRNRVVVASSSAALDQLAVEGARGQGTSAPAAASLPEHVLGPQADQPASPPPAPNHLSLSRRLRVLVSAVAALGIGVGLFFTATGGSSDLLALAVLLALVAVGQALAVEMHDEGTISLTAVGSLAGAAMFGPRVALPIALAVCVVEWSARHAKLHTAAFNVGVITLASVAGAQVYELLPENRWIFVAGGALAGAAYYAVNIGLLTTVIALETSDRWSQAFRARFTWLLPHYLVYGVVGAMVALAYGVAGVLALFVFALPLMLVRKAQLDYIGHTEESVRQLREAADTIERQNESLIQANTLLRDRATEAMESLAAAVDARDTYTAGHSRRVQGIAVAVGNELDLDGPELESLSFAALFHDVGKLAVPDALLLKSGPLDEREWRIVRRHAEEGERIIGHLGFLSDAAPAIRHHHEHFDGSGYPDGLSGHAIPLGARILHVADAFDSMTTTRVYRAALSVDDALAELRRTSGTQFCPTCVAALERVVESGYLAQVRAVDAPPAAA